MEKNTKKDAEIGLTESLCVLQKLTQWCQSTILQLRTNRQTPRRRISPLRRFRLQSDRFSIYPESHTACPSPAARRTRVISQRMRPQAAGLGRGEGGSPLQKRDWQEVGIERLGATTAPDRQPHPPTSHTHTHTHTHE